MAGVWVRYKYNNSNGIRRFLPVLLLVYLSIATTAKAIIIVIEITALTANITKKDFAEKVFTVVKSIAAFAFSSWSLFCS